MATTARNQDMDEELVARLVQQVDNGRSMPMPICADGVPFGRTDRHIFAASAVAGCDATFSLDLTGPLTTEQRSKLNEKEPSRWRNLQAFANGLTPGKEEES